MENFVYFYLVSCQDRIATSASKELIGGADQLVIEDYF